MEREYYFRYQINAYFTKNEISLFRSVLLRTRLKKSVPVLQIQFQKKA